jgi:hypothetical protein
MRRFKFYKKYTVSAAAVLRDISGSGVQGGVERNKGGGGGGNIKYGRLRRPNKFSRRRKKSKSTDTDSSSR